MSEEANNLSSVENKIVEFFKVSKRKYKFKKLVEIFNFDNDELMDNLKEILFSLEKKGKIYKNDNDEYMLFPKDKNLFVGILKQNKRGQYYVVQNNKSIIISDDKLNDAIIGDYVLIQKNIFNDTSYINIIKRIISRENGEIIFDCTNKNGVKVLKPYKTRYDRQINLSQDELDSLRFGERVKIKIDQNGKAKIIDYIGLSNSQDLELNTIIAEHGEKIRFSKESLEELKNIPSKVRNEDLKNRIDLRDKMFVTIDGKDCKDMDDAVCIERAENGNYILMVGIADLPYYIKFDSALFKDGYERGNSIYPGNYVRPQFPEEISNGICSLNPNVDRLIRYYRIELDNNCKVIDFEYNYGVINSKKKMSYEDVNRILDKHEILEDYKIFNPMLNEFREIHKKLDTIKKTRGYINFGDRDIKFSDNDKGSINKIFQPIRGTGEKMIEDFMLLANQLLATYAQNLDIPFSYRVEDTPNKETMENCLNTINQLGYKIKYSGALKNPIAVQGLIKQISNLKIYPILADQILQGMKKAVYSTDNIGHFGLAISNQRNEAYCHSTSPIRRISDYMNHYSLDLYFKGYTTQQIDNMNKFFQEACNHASQKEKIADEIERDCSLYLMAKYMESHIGDDFVGTIYNITKTYMTIKTDEGIIGKINLKDYGENCKYNSQNMSITINDQEYHLGDTLYVQVKSANREERKIRFKLKKNNEPVRTRKESF